MFVPVQSGLLERVFIYAHIFYCSLVRHIQWLLLDIYNVNCSLLRWKGWTWYLSLPPLMFFVLIYSSVLFSWTLDSYGIMKCSGLCSYILWISVIPYARFSVYKFDYVQHGLCVIKTIPLSFIVFIKTLIIFLCSEDRVISYYKKISGSTRGLSIVK